MSLQEASPDQNVAPIHQPPGLVMCEYYGKYYIPNAVDDPKTWRVDKGESPDMKWADCLFDVYIEDYELAVVSLPEALVEVREDAQTNEMRVSLPVVASTAGIKAFVQVGRSNAGTVEICYVEYDKDDNPQLANATSVGTLL